MAVAIEDIKRVQTETGAWSLPERLPGEPNIRLSSDVNGNSGLSPDELSIVNFGVTEAARSIFKGGGTRPGFGYTLEPRTRNVYSIRHSGVEGLIIRRGSIFAPEFVLFRAGRVEANT